MAFMHFDESIETIKNIENNNYKKEKRYLTDTLGYILAEDIVADHNSPEFTTSAMDGYDIKHEDLALGCLKIASITPAGSNLVDDVIGACCIIPFTGSLMPAGLLDASASC